MAIYSLEEFPADALNNYPAYIKEAANRALSNSELGRVVISDQKEGANIQGGNNSGEYEGIKYQNI
jgi:hypothetical protein